MMQTSVNQSGMRGVPPFWQTHTIITPPTQWEDSRDIFQSALVAKENIDIKNLLNTLDLLRTKIQKLEESTQNESTTAKAERTIKLLKKKEDSTNPKTLEPN